MGCSRQGVLKQVTEPTVKNSMRFSSQETDQRKKEKKKVEETSRRQKTDQKTLETKSASPLARKEQVC